MTSPLKSLGIGLQEVADFLGMQKETLKKSLQRGSLLPTSAHQVFVKMKEGAYLLRAQPDEKGPSAQMPLSDKDQEKLHLHVLKLQIRKNRLEDLLEAAKRKRFIGHQKLRWLTYMEENPPESGYTPTQKLWLKVYVQEALQQTGQQSEWEIRLLEAKRTGLLAEIAELSALAVLK